MTRTGHPRLPAILRECVGPHDMAIIKDGYVRTLRKGYQQSYLARLHTTTGFEPAVSGFVTRYFSSSPESSILRFCAVPVQFGSIACSTCHVSMRSASLNDHFPQCVKFPTTVVLYSSGVACARSPDANFACPVAAMCSE